MERLHHDLAQLDSLLRETPNDPSLVSLREELLELIAHTEGRRKKATTTTTELTPASASSLNNREEETDGKKEEGEEDEGMMHVPEVSSWTTVVKTSSNAANFSSSSSANSSTKGSATSSSSPPPSSTTVNAKRDTNVHDVRSTTINRRGGPSASSSSPPLEEEDVDLLPNQRCEIRPAGEKRWQGAVVEERLPDFEYRVQRLFDGEKFHVKSRNKEIRTMTVPEEELRLSSLLPNMRLHARYSGDGKYYPAIVQKVADHGCLVLYEGFEDDPPEHVALEHLRLPPPGSTAALRSTSSAFEIPPELVVLPTDGEEERQSKLKQQKVLKRKRVLEEMELRQETKQHSWQAFQATAKRPKGSFTAVSGAAKPSTLFERKKPSSNVNED